MARNKIPYQAKLVNGMYRVKKTRGFNKSTEELRALVKREVKETNRRLKQLEKPIDLNKGKYNPKTRRYERSNQIIFTTPTGKKRIKTSRLKSYKGLYASKKLSDLDMINKKGKIKYTGTENRTELLNIHKELESFLKNKTSRLLGINEVASSTVETLGINLDVSPEEAETLYNFFIDPDFKGVQEYIKGSDFMYILNDSVSKNKDSSAFVETIKDYISDDKVSKLNTDVDMIDKLKRIYTKYLSVQL